MHDRKTTTFTENIKPYPESTSKREHIVKNITKYCIHKFPLLRKRRKQLRNRGLSASETACPWQPLCPWRQRWGWRNSEQTFLTVHPFPNILAGLLMQDTHLFELSAFFFFFTYSECRCEVLLISKITKSWTTKGRNLQSLKTTKWIINQKLSIDEVLLHLPNHLFDILFSLYIHSIFPEKNSEN